MLIARWLAAALVFGGSGAFAKPAPLMVEAVPVGQIDRTTIADEVAIKTDSGDRMTVDVSVSGQGPYRFLVDTGSERTVISRELAQQLRLQDGRLAVLHSVLGTRDVKTVFIPHLKVSSNTISVFDAPALGASDIGADGMLGTDSLRSQRVLFDFRSNTMSITPSSRPVERLDGDTIVVRARSRGGRLIFTQAKIDGRKVTVIVDTGSQVTIANMALRSMLAKRGLLRVPETMTITSVTGEKLAVQVSQLGKLELGGLKVEDLAVAYADAHIFRQLKLDKQPALLLGMNAMRAFDRISIDFANKKVRFVLPGTSMRSTVRLAAAGGH